MPSPFRPSSCEDSWTNESETSRLFSTPILVLRNESLEYNVWDAVECRNAEFGFYTEFSAYDKETSVLSFTVKWTIDIYHNMN